MGTSTHMGMGMTLTPRDRNIIELLDELSVLTTEQISTLFFPSISSCRNRLVILKRVGWLKEKTPHQFYNNSRKILMLGKKSCEVFKYSICKAHQTSYIDHQLGLNEIYLRLVKKEVLKTLNIIWQDGSKFILPYEKTHLRPDARIIHPIDNFETYIEYDRGTKNILTIGENISHYLSYYDEKELRSKKDEFGVVQIIYITPKKSRAVLIQEQFQKLCFKQQRTFLNVNFRVLFRTFTEEEFFDRAAFFLDHQKTNQNSFPTIKHAGRSHPNIKEEQQPVIPIRSPESRESELREESPEKNSTFWNLVPASIRNEMEKTRLKKTEVTR